MIRDQQQQQKPKTNMKPKPEHTTQRLKTLLHCEDNLETDLGAWFPGERVVFRGKDLFSELNDLPWMSLLLYGITGRLINSKQNRLFESIWALCVSYPDPRLWNNRVAALAGTARSTGALGVAAATAVTEAKIYGGQANFGAIEFVKHALNSYQRDPGNFANFVNDELKTKRVIPGFGRPIVANDERIPPLMRVVTELGYQDEPHLNLVFEVERILLEGRKRMRMNITGLAAALAADQGLTTQEYSAYLIHAFGAGIVPCYLNAVETTAGSFFPLRCDRIQYEGQETRKWA